jgi:hypothetical protein
MLFDLQSRGRKNFVRVIYLGLAILMGGGLLLFGIGTGTNQSGFFDLLNNNGSSSSAQTSSAEKRAARLVRVNPSNATAWAALARARYQSADFDTNRQVFTAKGKHKLASASTAWHRYLALDPPRPDSATARIMATAYSETGLNQPASAAGALEIVAAADPSEANYATLAQYAYQAYQTRKGDLAAAKALQLAPKLQRKSLKQALDAIKKKATQAAVQKAVQQGGVRTTGG